MQAHPFQTAEAALQFIMAGNATITLRSRVSDQRFTFKIRAKDDGAIHFVSLLRGSDNENDFSYFGFIRRGVFFHGGLKAKVSRDAPSAAGFEWAWKSLVRDHLPTTLEVWHEGRCGRCGRKLTVPSSIANGIGPECAQRTGVAALSRDFRAEGV